MNQPTSQAPLAQPAPAGHPRGLYVLFFTEMWERFSYYGMRALLVLFMVEAIDKHGLGMDETKANAIYGLYTALVYLVALPGGWIADRLLGARKSVWYGGIIIACGHFTLAIPRTDTFYLGLLLIIIGTGLLKPNISAIVGDLYQEGDARRDAGFTIFYMGINLGATLGAFICSFLGEKINWHYGFAAAGFGMVLGLIQYRVSARHLGEAGLRPRRKDNLEPREILRGWLYVFAGLAVVLIVVALGFLHVIPINPVFLTDWTTLVIGAMGVFYFAAVFIFGGLDVEERKRMTVLGVLLLACVFFWLGFEQAGSSFNLFAKNYTLRVIPWINYEIPAGWFQMLNSIMIILFAPVMAMLWTMLTRRNINLSTPAKFALGLILLGAGFLVMAWASALIGPGKKVWPSWLILTYLLHTLGELCLSPVGLSATTKLSPRRFTGQMIGMWFLATALGNLIAGRIAGRLSASPVEKMPMLYLVMVMVITGFGVILLGLSKPLRKLTGNVD